MKCVVVWDQDRGWHDCPNDADKRVPGYGYVCVQHRQSLVFARHEPSELPYTAERQDPRTLW